MEAGEGGRDDHEALVPTTCISDDPTTAARIEALEKNLTFASL